MRSLVFGLLLAAGSLPLSQPVPGRLSSPLGAIGRQYPIGLQMNAAPANTVKPINHSAKKPISLSRGFGLGYAG